MGMSNNFRRVAHMGITMRAFEPIRPTRAYEAVAEQIEKAILAGRFKIGTKLPPEREIVKLFDISRRTFREALRILDQKGLIQVKLGAHGGAFVVDKVHQRMAESIGLMICQKKISVKDLTEFRSHAEGHVAELATRRASKENLKKLEYIFLQSKPLFDKEELDYDEILELENELHLELARLSGNALCAGILETVHTALVFPSYKNDLVNDSYVIRAFKDWEKILKAINEKRAAYARQLIIEHVELFSQLDSKQVSN